MPTSYELFLRAAAGGTVDGAALERALAARDLGGMRAEPFIGDGEPARPRGLDLAFPGDAAVGPSLDLAFALAQELELEVFDPQLGRIVGASDRERVAERLDELRAFSADTLGEAGAFARLPAPEPAGRARLHLWLLVAGAVIGFLLLARGCRYFL